MEMDVGAGDVGKGGKGAEPTEKKGLRRKRGGPRRHVDGWETAGVGQAGGDGWAGGRSKTGGGQGKNKGALGHLGLVNNQCCF